MILKEKYTKYAKLNNLYGSIVFFANEKNEIKNINKLINSSQYNIFNIYSYSFGAFNNYHL